MAKEKPGEKKLKTVEERLLSGKKALLESYIATLDNPETPAEKIESLKQEAGKLIEEIQYLEEKTVSGLRQTDPIDAGKIERELSPIVDEALEIQRQLAELDAQEAALDTEEVDIDKKISALNTNTGDIPEVEVEDASISAKQKRKEKEKAEKKREAEEELKRKAWEEAQEEVKNTLVSIKNTLDLLFKKSKASKRELAASITKAITFVIDKNVGLDNEQMVFLTTLRLDLGRVADNQFTSQLDGMSLVAKISEAQRQFNKVFEKTLKPATQTGSTGYRKDSKPEIEVVKEDKAMKLREGSVEDAKINLRVDPEFVNVLKELVLRNNSAVNVTVIMNENPVLKQHKKRAENVLRQMNEMGLFEPAETNGYKFLKIKKPKELEDKLAGYELEFDEVYVSKKVDEIIRTSLDGTRIESYTEVIQTLRELLGRIDPAETGDIQYVENIIAKLSETYEENTTQREETDTMTDIMNRYSQDNNPEQTLAELRAFQARGIRTEQVANAVDSFIKQIESLLAPEPDKKAKKKRKSQNPPGPAPAPADTEEDPNIDQESWLTQEVNAFIAEFGLEELLPPDFRKLKQEQQLKTIQDLKHRIVDIVKQDAKAHYNEAVGGEKARANIFGKLAIGVREAFKKETNIKNAERNEFEKIKGTDEGRKLVAEQMKLLAEINGGQEIVVGADGKLLIDYSEQLGVGTGSGQAELRAEYNTAANAFRSIPYEWGLAKEGSREKMAYEDAKAAYDTAVEKVLEVKKFAPGQEAKAIKDMMEIKNSLMLEQFLNTHPDIEIELGKLEQGAGKEQIKETILRLAGIQNREKAALLAAGYGARVITKATLGAIAAPIVGAVFGYLRAKSRAKETLIEKGKEARYGGVDNGPGVMNVASTEFKDSKGREAGLHYKLEALIQEIEQKQSRNEDCTKLIARLNSRIMYTRNKIDAGLVNFGGQKEVLKNQYLLLDALNRAIVLVSAAELNVKKEVDQRLESILAIRSKRISKEYIEDQAVLGAVRGAGIATAGYIVRAIGEEIGLWGVQETTSRPYAEEQPDSKPPADSGYMGEKSVAETQDTLIANSERGINPPTENPVASGETAAPKDTSTASIADKGVKAPEDNVGGDNKSGGGPAEEKTEKPKVNERPVKSVKQDTGSVEAKPRNIPSAPEVKDLPTGLDAKAVVGEGGGITFAFKQQLEGNDELAQTLKKQIGFTGKIGTKAFYEALGKEFGYIKENGEWIGVDKGNVAAYQFVKGANGYEVQEYHLVGKDWKLIETHNSDGQTFEGKDYEKEYEYLNKPKRQVEDEEGDEDKPMREKTGTTKQQPTEEGRTGKRVGHEDDEENSMQLMEASKEEMAQLEKSLFGNKKSVPDGEKNNVPINKNFRKNMTVPPTGEPRTVILESDKQDVKWRIEPGPPDGRPWIVEDFKLVGPKALRMFADRYGYEDLNTSQVDFVGQRYRFNLNKIFARSEDWTDKWSKEPATRLLRVNVGDNVSGNKEKLANYIQMLHDEVKKTGKTMEPFNDGFVGNKETTKDYILRMLFELEKRGKLDAFNDKFDNFMKGHGDLGSGDNTPEVPDTENAVEFNPAKTDMYELWEKYKKQPESLSEEEYTFAEKVEGLRKKLGSNFSSIQTGETAEHYLKRLESKTK